jgi:hypothetical protein
LLLGRLENLKTLLEAKSEFRDAAVLQVETIAAAATLPKIRKEQLGQLAHWPFLPTMHRRSTAATDCRFDFVCPLGKYKRLDFVQALRQQKS